MLSKKNRLKKKKDFEKIFKSGQSAREDFLLLKYLNNNLIENRFGFIVSQKVSKKATMRNKLKRRLREAVRDNLKRMKGGRDGILIALPGLEKKESAELKETVSKIFKKIDI